MCLLLYHSLTSQDPDEVCRLSDVVSVFLSFRVSGTRGLRLGATTVLWHGVVPVALYGTFSVGACLGTVLSKVSICLIGWLLVCDVLGLDSSCIVGGWSGECAC